MIIRRITRRDLDRLYRACAAEGLETDRGATATRLLAEWNARYGDDTEARAAKLWLRKISAEVYGIEWTQLPAFELSTRIHAWLLTRHRSKEIRWLGTQQDLLYLIRKLIDNELIGPEAKSIYAAIAAHHFVDRNGKPFKPDQLRVVWSGMHRKEAKSATRRRIDPIVEKIRGK